MSSRWRSNNRVDLLQSEFKSMKSQEDELKDVISKLDTEIENLKKSKNVTESIKQVSVFV